MENKTLDGASELSILAKKLGKLGGQATFNRHGKDHYKMMAFKSGKVRGEKALSKKEDLTLVVE